jgi:hypothetical protein
VAALRRMFGALGWPVPEWLGAAEREWSQPAPGPRVRAAIPIWRDPWMVVGSATFTGDLAARLGLENVYGDDPGRYPRIDLDDLAAREPELIVLPDEPYAFSAGDGPEMFPRQRVALRAARPARRGPPRPLIRRSRRGPPRPPGPIPAQPRGGRLPAPVRAARPGTGPLCLRSCSCWTRPQLMDQVITPRIPG